MGGCHNVQRGFDLKQYDLSNLTGQCAQVKFIFFSDQFIELDGWYIDDAGIEIDVYEPEGSWISDLLVPDPSLDGVNLTDLSKSPRIRLYVSIFLMTMTYPYQVFKTALCPLIYLSMLTVIPRLR